MIGETISHYRIIEKLGEGGMGIVYKAEDTRLKRIVALKFLPHILTGDKEAKQRFIQEAQSASTLQSNNVCTLHDIVETDDNNLFIVMDCYEGETLKEKIQKGPLKIETVMDISVQVCRGLAAAHEKGIVHRDIKPSNIFVTKDGTVKIIDFGLAKLSGNTQLTKAGTTPGTINFMSPEQIKGEDVNQRSDIWAMGVVMYEMITGQQPFKGDYEQAVTYSILNEHPEPVTGIRTGVPIELERIVFKMLEKDPDERYQHIDDVLADLKKVMKEIEGENSGRITKTETTSRSKGINNQSKRKTPLILIPAVLIILAVILLVYNPFSHNNLKSSTTGEPVKSLAVMYFENLHDPADKEHTGEMMTNLLITSLSQIRGLEVISRERLLDIQKDLGYSDANELSPELANKVAVQAGVNTMLIGSILREKPSFAVTTRLIDVETGKIISSEQLKNYPGNAIFDLVDTLAILLQNDFQSPEESTGEIKPITEVTTGSQEAYRAYVEGLDLITKLYFEEAKAAFRKAIELDNNFAMAYFYLGFIQINSGRFKEGNETFRKAAALADNVTERERLQILAFNNFRPDRTDKLVAYLNKLKEQYPHEIFPYLMYNFLCNNYLLEPERAVENCKRGLQYNPKAKMIWNFLAYSYGHLNMRAKGISAVNKYINLAPAEPNPYDTEGDLYAWFGEYDSSRQAYLKAVSLRKNFASATKLGYFELLDQNYDKATKYFQMIGYRIPLIDIHRGNFNDALKNMANINSLNRKIHIYYELHNFSEMLKAAEAYSSELHNDPSDIIYARDYVAWALIKNDRFSDANKLLSEIKKDASGTTPRLEYIAEYTTALLLFEEEKYEASLKQFETIFQMLPVNHEPNYFYAVCLFKTGQLSKSVKELNRLTNWINGIYIIEEVPGALGYWPVQNIKAHYWLGAAYEEQGKKAEAVKEYKKFVEIWKDADFDPPELNDAKKKLKILVSVIPEHKKEITFLKK